MKKCLKICIWILLPISFIMTGCTMDKSVENQPVSDSSHLYNVKGKVTEIMGKNIVLVNVLKGNRDFQKEDTVAVKYDISQESEVGLDNLEDFEAKPMEAQVGDFVSVSYFKAEMRDIGELKDCHYISTWYLGIIPEERYKAMYPDDAE